MVAGEAYKVVVEAGVFGSRVLDVPRETGENQGARGKEAAIGAARGAEQAAGNQAVRPAALWVGEEKNRE